MIAQHSIIDLKGLVTKIIKLCVLLIAIILLASSACAGNVFQNIGRGPEDTATSTADADNNNVQTNDDPQSANNDIADNNTNAVKGNIKADTGNIKADMGNGSSGRFIYNGFPVESLYGFTENDVRSLFGNPDFVDTSWYSYNEIGGFSFDERGVLDNINGWASMLEVDGVAAELDRAGLVKILGSPAEEGYAHLRAGPPYGMIYHIEGITFEFWSYGPDNGTEAMLVTIRYAEAESPLAPIPMPPSGSSPTEILAHVIFDGRFDCMLSVYWDNGTLTELEHNAYTGEWMMYGRDGNIRDVYPTFSHMSNVFEIGFPLTTTRLYYLYDNNTGEFGEETFTWEFSY